jgi:gas vesicle protein
MKLFESQEKKKEKPASVLPLAAVIALVGGVGAALVASPKGKRIRENLQEVGDDVVHVLERVLDKVDTGKDVAGEGLSDFSKVFLSVVDEMKALHESAEEPKKTSVQKVEEKIMAEVTHVEQVVEHDVSSAAQWFQKKAKSLAKREYK